MKDMGETQKKVFGYFRAYEAEQFSFYRIVYRGEGALWADA